jgi:trehalose 2-sulfotransferase
VSSRGESRDRAECRIFRRHRSTDVIAATRTSSCDCPWGSHMPQSHTPSARRAALVWVPDSVIPWIGRFARWFGGTRHGMVEVARAVRDEQGRRRPMATGYIICTTPRSGSTLLCRLLAATGRTGNPDSFYHRAEFMREWAAKWGLPDADTMSGYDFDSAYLRAAVKAGNAGTGIFGLRLQQKYLALLTKTLDHLYPGLPSDTRRFERAFGAVLYLHLSRSDKVAQAVSLVKAEQSGLWHRNADGSEYERLAAPQRPAYDFKSIHREVIALERADNAWGAWFHSQRIEPFRISYEAFADHPGETLIDICWALGSDPPEAGTIKPDLAKLSDAVSVAWIHRYKADLNAASRDTDPLSS